MFVHKVFSGITQVHMGVLPKRMHKHTHRVYSFGYCLNDSKPWEVWAQVASLVAFAATCSGFMHPILHSTSNFLKRSVDYF